jgi:hypothetical protein
MKLALLVSVFLTTVSLFAANTDSGSIGADAIDPGRIASGHTGSGAIDSASIDSANKTIPIPVELLKILNDRQEKLAVQQKIFEKDLPIYALLIPLKLIEADIHKIGTIDLHELVSDFKKITYSPVDAFATIEVAPGVERHGSVCVPKISSVVVNLPTYASVGYDVLTSAELLLHEALCSIPDPSDLQKRKYNDSSYQISSRVLLLFHLILEKKLDQAKKLASEPIFTDEINLACCGNEGGISGGPGGGDFDSLHFKVQLLLKLEELRTECSQSQALTNTNTSSVDLIFSPKTITLKGFESSLEVPCYMLNISWLRKAIYQTFVEPPPYINVSENPALWLAANKSIIYNPKPEKSGAINAKINFSVGLLVKMTNAKELAAEALRQILAPCLNEDSAAVCFYDKSYVKTREP